MNATATDAETERTEPANPLIDELTDEIEVVEAEALQNGDVRVELREDSNSVPASLTEMMLNHGFVLYQYEARTEWAQFAEVGLDAGGLSL